MRSLTVQITPPAVQPERTLRGVTLDVVCGDDGMLTVTVDPTTLARLAGREGAGPAAPIQGALRDKVTDAWYAAKCPQPPQ